MESFQIGTAHSLGPVKTWVRPARGKECIRYTTLTQETPIKPRVAFSWLESQIWSGRMQTGEPHHGISIRLIYNSYFQLSPHWMPLTLHTSPWCDIANMVLILHGKWPQRHLSNQSLPNAGCAYYLCKLPPNNLTNGLCFLPYIEPSIH